MSEMDSTWARRDMDRFEVMKHLRVEGVREFSRMVPRLRELALQSCPKCDDPKNQRKNRDGVDICVTCEDTIRKFWSRHTDRLTDDDADVPEIRWELKETYRFILATCRKQAVRKAETITTRVEHVPAVGETPAHDVTHTTTREEWLVDAGLLRLAGDTMLKLARITGLDVEEPEESENEGQQQMVTIERADGSEEDFGTAN